MAWYPLLNSLKTALLPGGGLNRVTSLVVILLLGRKRFLKKLDAFLHRGGHCGHGLVQCHFVLFLYFDHHSLRYGKNFSLRLVPNSKIRRFHVQGHWSGSDGNWSGSGGNWSGSDGDWSWGDGHWSRGDGDRSGGDGDRSGGNGNWSGGDGDRSWGDGDWSGGDWSGGDGDRSGGDGDWSWSDGDWSWSWSWSDGDWS